MTTMNQAIDHPLLGRWLELFSQQAGRDAAMAEVLREQPQTYEALYALGNQLYEQDRFEDAVGVFEYITMQEPTDPRFALATAAALQMLRRHELALGYYGFAAMLDPLDPKPVLHGGECLLAMGERSQAREAMASVLRDYDASRRPDIRARAQALAQLIDSETPGHHHDH